MNNIAECVCAYVCVCVDAVHCLNISVRFTPAATGCLQNTIHPGDTASTSAHIRYAVCPIFITASFSSKTFSTNSHHAPHTHTHTSGLESSHSPSPANQTAENSPQRESSICVVITGCIMLSGFYFDYNNRITHNQTHTPPSHEGSLIWKNPPPHIYVCIKMQSRMYDRARYLLYYDINILLCWTFYLNCL